jgi:hypothetical protein
MKMTASLFWIALVALAACDDDDLYEDCALPEDCAAPDGKAAACVNKDAGGGFCSWLCSTDPDCDTGDDILYVCAPFESNPDKYCFPSCDAQQCPDDFECRSTGGGAENRKICFPL